MLVRQWFEEVASFGSLSALVVFGDVLRSADVSPAGEWLAICLSSFRALP